jgi:hypothetical protein
VGGWAQVQVAPQPTADRQERKREPMKVAISIVCLVLGALLPAALAPGAGVGNGAE